MFTPFRIGPMVVPNRVMVSPMCQYSADDGTPNDWHMVHLGGMAVGGAGRLHGNDERLTRRPDHAGLRRNVSGRHVPAWRRIVEFVHNNSQAKFCMQLAHAGEGSTKLPGMALMNPG